MKKITSFLRLLCIFFAAAFATTALPATAQQTSSMKMEHPAEVKPAPLPVNSAAWAQLKTLIGKWDGWADEGGKHTLSGLDIRSTGDGSALMHWMAEGTPYEMITMFHPDGDEILATHYCAAHNQPRLKLIPSVAPNQLTFDFKDGTNILPGAGHMNRLVVTFVDADHHDEAWSYIEPNKPVITAVFHYTRHKS